MASHLNYRSVAHAEPQHQTVRVRPASVLATAFVVQASRTKMLAMPVATTRRVVAKSNIEALAKSPLPMVSPNHSAAYPNSSISAIASFA